MIPDSYSPPVRNTEDIPIQRDSVSAMGMNTVKPPFKPYVYRGTGEDQIEMDFWLRTEVEREQAEHWERERKAAVQRVRAQRREQREREKEQRAVESIPQLVAKMHAGIEKALLRSAAREAASERASARKRRWDGVARPSPGWQPLKGEDLEDLWALLEED